MNAVRKALRMGADQGVHVNDHAIASSDAVATSLVWHQGRRRGRSLRRWALSRVGCSDCVQVGQPEDVEEASIGFPQELTQEER